MRAAELLRNKFGVSQLYKHQVEQGWRSGAGDLLASVDDC